MLINIDAKQLEWVVATFLSQDHTAIHELLNGVDAHADNQRRFKLPSRLVAKTLLFRIIYGGDGYSFSVDPKFGSLGSQRWWDAKIAEFYEKYAGLYSWHQGLMHSVIKSDGRLEVCTGRIYDYELEKRGWPRTKILNYPVQGLAADLMSIARVSLFKRLNRLVPVGLRWVNTVHDSIVFDIHPLICDTNKVVPIIEEVFADIPKNFEKLFGIPFNLPVRCDIEVGQDWGNLTKWSEYENRSSERDEAGNSTGQAALQEAGSIV